MIDSPPYEPGAPLHENGKERAVARALPAGIRTGLAWLDRHRVALWWLHSIWALAWGIVFMWLGTRHFAWLRLAFVYIAFIWLTGLFLPFVATLTRLSDRQRAFVRLAINYFNRNFYQQLLFFVLPVYAASVTWGSPNMLFVVIVAASAMLSTLDVVYDRHLSATPVLSAVFFAFNLFVCVNVALPVVWGISNHLAMRFSAVLALIGFVTLGVRPRHLAMPRVVVSLLAATLTLGLLIEWGGPLVPPAPLRLVSARMGLGFDRSRLAATNVVNRLPSGFAGRVYGVSAISAPLGLRDRVRHRWTTADRELYRSQYHTVTGGRTQGFRLWTSAWVSGLPPGTSLDLWIETEGGQIIGRARLEAGS